MTDTAFDPHAPEIEMMMHARAMRQQALVRADGHVVNLSAARMRHVAALADDPLAEVGEVGEAPAAIRPMSVEELGMMFEQVGEAIANVVNQVASAFAELAKTAAFQQLAAAYGGRLLPTLDVKPGSPMWKAARGLSATPALAASCPRHGPLASGGFCRRCAR